MNRKQTLPEGTPRRIGRYVCRGMTSVETGYPNRTYIPEKMPRHAGARRELWKGGKQECHLRSICKAGKNNSRSSWNNLLAKSRRNRTDRSRKKNFFFLMGKSRQYSFCLKWVILIVWSSSSNRKTNPYQQHSLSKVRTR